MKANFTPNTAAREHVKSSHWAAIAGGFAVCLTSAAAALYFLSAGAALRGVQASAKISSQAASASLAEHDSPSANTISEVGTLGSSLLAAEQLMDGASIAAYSVTSGARVAYSEYAAALESTRNALAPLEQGQATARQLRGVLLSKGAAIQQLMARLEPGRASASGSSAFESISRLQGYTYSGFGPEAASRLEYDVANLAFQLRDNGARDLRLAADDIYKAASPLILALKSGQVTGGQLADVIERVKAVAAYAAKADGEFARARTISLAGAIACGLMLAAGLVSMLFGLGAVVGDFGARVRSATMATRKEELAVVKLASDAKALADGNLKIEPTGTDEVTQSLAESLARIGLEIQRIQERAVQVASSARTRNASVAKYSQAVADALGVLSTELARINDAARDVGSNLQWVFLDVGVAQSQIVDIDDELGRCQRAVQDVVDRHDSIRSSVQEGIKRLKHVGEASQAVSMRVEDLASLCEHAQVVSMNAGLEAERAGHHGRGFRLIANDLRTLSLKLETASRQAMESISLMQANARGASESMESAAQRVISGTYVGDVAASLVGAARHDTDALLQSIRVIHSSADNEQAAAAGLAADLDAHKGVTQEIADQVEQVRAETTAGGREFTAAIEAIRSQA